MSILGDIINARGALQQQQQQKLMLQLMQQQAPQTMGLLSQIQGLMGGQQTPQGQQSQPPQGGLLGVQPPQGGLLGGSMPAVPNIPNFPAQLGQPMTGAPPQPSAGLGSAAAPNAAGASMAPYGLPMGTATSMQLGSQSAPQGAGNALPAQGSLGPDPWKLYQAGVGLAGSMFPSAAAEGKALMQYAAARIANDPAQATQLAAAKSPMAVAQAQYQQALAGNDPQDVQRAYTNLRNVSGQQHVGSMSGIMTMQLPNGNWATVNPSTGLQTVINPKLLENAPAGAQWLPGEVNAIRTRAAAESGGEAAGQAPYDMETVTDAQGNKYLVPKAQLLAPGTPGGAQPANASGAPALAGLGPQTQSALGGRGTQSQDYVMTSQKAADDATTANYALDNVIQGARGASIGPGAAAREFVEKNFAALGQSLLGSAFQPPKELANYQELDKYGNQLGFATARTMGSREAAQIVSMAIQSNPNKALTPQAFGWIANSMKAMNNYIIAKNQALQSADRQSPGAAQQAGSTWDAHVNPQVWDLSLDPGMAAQLAPKLGPQKIAAALPFMASADAVSAFRNIPASMRAAVLARMPAAAKQELAAGLRQ